MVEYAWPEALRPTRLTFYLQHNTTRFVSPITRQAQVLRREGARWVAQASFEPLDRRRGGILEGLLAALAGSLNTVRIYDWRREFRSGEVLGWAMNAPDEDAAISRDSLPLASRAVRMVERV
jgi:hypothetical protein